ncbi:hypothetical protein BCONGLO52_05050 [Brachybacterium conglomeratum]|uniref:Uncharacterized protein n=1 Tax=Brachybacterium conglomeratum TaxID=47846 RepID=A0ABQ5REU4_9MICO|nr:hypothetical protein BCONGLO52_05050 [Brachybacterium conglomeratum]GLK05468.1 hypothetical protein GCM10017597_22680 [Brachybacterium conglomeratum]
MAATFFPRPFPAPFGAAPAWRALTEVREVGRFAELAGAADVLAAAPVPAPEVPFDEVRLVPLALPVLFEDPLRLLPWAAPPFADFPEGVRRTPAARRLPPPLDGRRDSLMAAPGPSGAWTDEGAAASSSPV